MAGARAAPPKGDPVPVIVCSGRTTCTTSARPRPRRGGVPREAVRHRPVDRGNERGRGLRRTEAERGTAPTPTASSSPEPSGSFRTRSVSWPVMAGSVAARAPARTRRHARMVHAPGRPLPSRVPGAPRRSGHPRDDPPPEEAVGSPCSRCGGCPGRRDRVQRHRRAARRRRAADPDRAGSWPGARRAVRGAETSPAPSPRAQADSPTSSTRSLCW